MKLWVTGADGLLGSVLRNHATFATNRHEVDIGSLEAIEAFGRSHSDVTHIVNCAAFSRVDLAEVEREEAFKANALGPENLGIFAAKIGAKIIHISTDYVFPGTLRRPLKEEDFVEPCNYYGHTKLEGEQRLFRVNPNACVIRTSWIFGQGGKNFVANLLQMLREKEELRLTNDQWNLPTSVQDLAKVILRMADASGIYHFANRGISNKYEFGLAMQEDAKAAGFSIATQRILSVPGATFSLPAARPMYSVFDTSKIEKHLGMSIRPWREALREYLQEAYGTIT